MRRLLGREARTSHLPVHLLHDSRHRQLSSAATPMLKPHELQVVCGRIYGAGIWLHSTVTATVAVVDNSVVL